MSYSVSRDEAEVRTVLQEHCTCGPVPHTITSGGTFFFLHACELHALVPRILKMCAEAQTQLLLNLRPCELSGQ